MCVMVILPQTAHNFIFGIGYTHRTPWVNTTSYFQHIFIINIHVSVNNSSAKGTCYTYIAYRSSGVAACNMSEIKSGCY